MSKSQVGLAGNAEEMAAFFDLRVADYERQMAQRVEDFAAFYESVAEAIPDTRNAPRVLDLGVGTGLELDRLFVRCPNARVTGIDISSGMLDALSDKPWAERVRRVHGSFLEIDLGEARYDHAVSVMALHHWLPHVKLDLYRQIRRALVVGGTFAYADYVASEAESADYLATYEAAGHDDRHRLHIDLPLHLDVELSLLREAGFVDVRIPFRRAHCATFVSRAGGEGQAAVAGRSG